MEMEFKKKLNPHPACRLVAFLRFPVVGLSRTTNGWYFFGNCWQVSPDIQETARQKASPRMESLSGPPLVY